MYLFLISKHTNKRINTIKSKDMDACNSRDSTFFQVKCMKMIYIITYYFQFCPQLKYKKKLLGGVDEYTLEQNMLNYGGWLLWLHVKVVSAYIRDPYL